MPLRQDKPDEVLLEELLSDGEDRADARDREDRDREMEGLSAEL